MWGLEREGGCGCFGSQERPCENDVPSPSTTPPPKRKLKVDSGEKLVAKVEGNPPKGGDNVLVPIEIVNGFAVGYDAPMGADLGV